MAPPTRESLDDVLAAARAWRLCAPHLPHPPRPVLRAAPGARLLIVGQAPGTRVHESGVPWDDPSGDRLRGWRDVDRDTFYDAARIAIVPMGFCYPGRAANGGDAAPRPECAPAWHGRLAARLPDIALTLVVGRYAQAYYLGGAARRSVAETVRAWREFGPAFLPLPHPSWRTRAWVKRKPWFEAEVVPELRDRVRRVLASSAKD